MRAAAALALMLLVSAAIPQGTGIQHSNPKKMLDKPAPELRVAKWLNTGGKPLSLKNLRGKVVVLDFWTYWCGPCIASLPEIKNVYATYKSQGLVMIGIHCDSTTSKRDAMARDKKLTYPICQDQGGLTQTAYNVDGYPTVYVIDRQGVVRSVDPPDLEKAVKEVLARK